MRSYASHEQPSCHNGKLMLTADSLQVRLNSGEDLPVATERGRLAGLVVQDLLDVLHDLWRHLREQCQRLDVVLDLRSMSVCFV